MRQLYEYVENESTRSNGGKNLTIKVHRCCLKLHRSCFISFNFMNVSECFWS